MGIGYQKIDRKVIDYDLWFLDPGGPALRGPRMANLSVNLPKSLCCVGAAQTFGRFVREPYPTQLGRLLQIPVLNLGFSGAGPEFFLRDSRMMELIAGADTVVIQGMSARSVSAGLFKAMANNGVLEFQSGELRGQRMLAQAAYAKLRSAYGEATYQEQVRAVQACWVELNIELAKAAIGKKYFLWMSKCLPGENVNLQNSPVGEFPHFVTANMVSQVAEYFDDVIQCVLSVMPPQVLVHDFTGAIEPVFSEEAFPNRPASLRCFNTYYATPALHDLVVAKLLRKLT